MSALQAPPAAPRSRPAPNRYAVLGLICLAEFLAMSIWLARRLESGIVWVNCWDHGDMTQPWGGYKQTGQGRDKCFESLLAHTQTKSVWINLG